MRIALTRPIPNGKYICMHVNQTNAHTHTHIHFGLGKFKLKRCTISIE